MFDIVRHGRILFSIPHAIDAEQRAKRAEFCIDMKRIERHYADSPHSRNDRLRICVWHWSMAFDCVKSNPRLYTNAWLCTKPEFAPSSHVLEAVPVERVLGKAVKMQQQQWFVRHPCQRVGFQRSPVEVLRHLLVGCIRWGEGWLSRTRCTQNWKGRIKEPVEGPKPRL